MCLAPILLPDGQLAGCRNCWQCDQKRVLDWVGRCVAEASETTATYFVTLTYGRDKEGREYHPQSLTLTYSDIQKYLKLMRKKYQVRYLCAGEYGERKGRAHWHLILFINGKQPTDIELSFGEQNKRFHTDEWKHGHQVWKKGNPHHYQYVCKYILKNDAKQSRVTPSRYPPLGDAYFRRLAREYAEKGLVPRSYMYKMPEVRDKKGQPLKFMMSGKTAENFIEEYLDAWNKKHPGRHFPHSEIVEEYLDKKQPIDPDWVPDSAQDWYKHQLRKSKEWSKEMAEQAQLEASAAYEEARFRKRGPQPASAQLIAYLQRQEQRRHGSKKRGLSAQK